MKEQQSIILVVDDAPENIRVVKELLKEHCQIRFATSGEKALKIMSEDPLPDLILLDIMMPGMDGYQVCRRLKTDPRTRVVPIIFLTAKANVEDERKGLESGAVDYITKPISPPILLVRVKTHLRLKEASEFLRKQNDILEQKVHKRTRQLSILQDATIVALGSLAETRDNETGNHIRRTQYYVKTLAQVLQNNHYYSEVFTNEYIDLLFKSAPLHDIGKVGVPDNILLKPGKLTEDEFNEMKRHTIYGRDAITAAVKTIKDEDAAAFLKMAQIIAYSHHEKWDGTGYPEGFSGDNIPISARLMAIADVYDALISRRVYKEPVSHEQAFAIIKEGHGSHFDPVFVDVFISIADQFKRIAQEFTNA